MNPRELTDLYPALAALPADAFNAFAATATPIDVPAGTVLFDERARCQGIPLVLDGCVRVMQVGQAGERANARDFDLYRINPGELCLVSTCAQLTGTLYRARAVAVSALRLVLLPAASFDEFHRHAEFRRFIYSQLAERLQELLSVMEGIAFQRLDQRVANALLGRGRVLRITHQHLADELGTIREVVTRVLGRCESAGAVALNRERIEILDPARLRQIAEHGIPTC